MMDMGCPVGVKFIANEPAPHDNRFFCELVQHARCGESIHFSEQGCPVGAYVLGSDMPRPDEYYFNSGRYLDRESAARAASSLPIFNGHNSSIQISPIIELRDPVDFDIILLFLSPAGGMRLIQALSFHDGSPLMFSTGGTASVCGDCTIAPFIAQQLCISLGCKGSRKHSRYSDFEMVAGIPRNLVEHIENGLAALPDIMD